MKATQGVMMEALLWTFFGLYWVSAFFWAGIAAQKQRELFSDSDILFVWMANFILMPLALAFYLHRYCSHD